MKTSKEKVQAKIIKEIMEEKGFFHVKVRFKKTRDRENSGWIWENEEFTGYLGPTFEDALENVENKLPTKEEYKLSLKVQND